MNTFEKFVTIRRMLVNRAAEVMMYENWDNEFAVKQIRHFPFDVMENMKDGKLLFDIQPSELTEQEMIEFGFGKWSSDSKIYLIPLWSFPFLADGIDVEFIDGRIESLDKCKVDTDNRFGCLAFGVSPKSV